MQRFNFETISESELLKIYNHHARILGRASEIRLLNDSELDFLMLFPMLECEMISMFEFRLGCKTYFES